MEKVIKVKNLSRHFKVHKRKSGLKESLKSVFHREYELVKAVDNVSFEINQGEFVGFIGPNGAGKTTTLKMLSGLLYPTSGEVDVLGYFPFDKKHDFLRQISLVMGQKNQLFWDLPAEETFKLIKKIYDIPDGEYNKTVNELIELLDVTDIVQKQVRKMSLGQRMKCEFIASLIYKPKVLFLDEPTIGLDVVMQKKLREFIKEYNRKYKTTIILTSHYMEDVKELCERVIIIDKGKIGYDGSLEILIKKYAKSKRITLVFIKPVKKKDLMPYGRIIKYERYKVTFEIPKSDISDVASKLLKDFDVDDVDISEISIEEIVRQIFTNHKI